MTIYIYEYEVPACIFLHSPFSLWHVCVRKTGSFCVVCKEGELQLPLTHPQRALISASQRRSVSEEQSLTSERRDAHERRQGGFQDRVWSTSLRRGERSSPLIKDQPLSSPNEPSSLKANKQTTTHQEATIKQTNSVLQ